MEKPCSEIFLEFRVWDLILVWENIGISGLKNIG